MKESNLTLIYKLELERNLRRSLQRITFWCKFFGVAPVNLSFESTAEKSQSIFSRQNLKSNFLFVLHVMWSLSILTAISISIYYERSYDERDSTSFILKCLYMGEYLFNIFNCTLIVVGCHYQRRVYNQHFHRIVAIDMEFKECGVTTNYSQLKKYIKKFWYYSASFMLLATISDLMYYFSLKDFVRSAIVFILSNLLTIVTLIEYFGLLYVLKEGYKSICNVLLQLVDQNDEFSKRKSFENHAILTVFDVMKIRPNAYVDPTLAIIQRLNKLRKIYYDLAMFNEDINTSFGILIISTTMTTFIVVSTQLYAFYDIAKSPDGINDIYLAIYSGLWFIFNSGKVILILLLNHYVCVEVIYCRNYHRQSFSFEYNKQLKKRVFSARMSSVILAFQNKAKKNVFFSSENFSSVTTV